MALIRHGPTADFLAEALKSRASQDEVFANLVVQSCVQSPVTKTPSTPCKRSASALKSRVMNESPGKRPGVEPRSLLQAFEESPKCPAKAAKLQNVEAGLLDPLPSVLVAQVSSFLKLRDKVLFLGCNRQARILRQLQCTWQPLVLDAEDCAYVLRRIRNCDPQGHLEPKFYPGPACAAWTEVAEVTVELMEADRVDGEHGETLQPQFRKASAMTKLILDPIQEFARRLSAGWFAGAKHLRLLNIEVTCMDSGFLDFRRSAFRDFCRLKLEQDGLDPMKYCLHASRETYWPPSIKDGYAMVKNRFPQGPAMSRLLSPPEEITESEALFLQEHTLMVKTGRTFRSVERLWHVIAESDVREQYDVPHAQLMDLNLKGQ